MTYEELESLIAKATNSIEKSANLIAKASEEFASWVAEGKETDRRLRETDEQMKRTDLKMDRIFENMESRSDRLDRQIDEVSKHIDKVSKQIGGIDNNIGYHVEQFFQNVFTDNKVFGGIKYNDIILNMKHDEEGEGVEFDIVLKNGRSVALIEVKNRIRTSFVKKLAKERLSKFREYFPKYKNYDVYLGIAGFSIDKAVFEEAKKYGVGIIRQVGEGIEVDATSLKVYRHNQPRI